MHADSGDSTNEIELPQGLLGLPECRRFELEPTAREGFFWLRSLDVPELSFVLVDPFPHFESYGVDVSPADQADLGPFDRSELLVLTVVSLGAGAGDPVTTNLRGPIAVNLRTHRAKQLVVSDPDLALRAPFDPFPRVSAAI